MEWGVQQKNVPANEIERQRQSFKDLYGEYGKRHKSLILSIKLFNIKYEKWDVETGLDSGLEENVFGERYGRTVYGRWRRGRKRYQTVGNYDERRKEDSGAGRSTILRRYELVID